MKKFFYFAAALTILLAGCEEYDDSWISERFDALEEQVQSNTNAINALKNALEEAVKKGLTVEVEEIEGGHRLTFSDNTSIDVMNGTDGQTGPQGPAGSDATVSIKESPDGYSYIITVGNQEYIIAKGVDTNTLKAMEAANCFIISEAGIYKFLTVKGNSSESVGAVASCELLWETYNTDEYPEKNTLIKSVSYADGAIVFSTVDKFKEGNAGIAAKDAEGNVLWSWHIWLTDRPAEQVYFNNAGTFLDRNIGALSAAPGEVEALGLLFQWGRKDPFLGSASIDESKQTGSTLKVEHDNSEYSDWPTVATNEERGTIEWAIAHPTTFIGFTYDLEYSINTYDWIYTEDLTSDKTRWNPDTKTIYDPCPAGWRVPHKNFTIDAVGTTESYYDSAAALDNGNKGLNWGGIFGSDESIWYPFSGDRGQDIGNLSQVGTDGCVWTASFHDSKPQAYSIQNYVYYGQGSFSRARKDCSKAYAVRCMKIQ